MRARERMPKSIWFPCVLWVFLGVQVRIPEETLKSVQREISQRWARGAATPRHSSFPNSPRRSQPAEMAKKAKKAPEEEAPKKGKKSAAKK